MNPTQTGITLTRRTHPHKREVVHARGGVGARNSRRMLRTLVIMIALAWASGCDHSTALTASPVVLSRTPTVIMPRQPVAAHGPITDFIFHLPGGYRCGLNEWLVYTPEGRPIALSVTAVSTHGKTDHFGGPSGAGRPDSRTRACEERRASATLSRDPSREYERFEFSATESLGVSGIGFVSGQPRTLAP